jgi:hypothetical protein
MCVGFSGYVGQNKETFVQGTVLNEKNSFAFKHHFILFIWNTRRQLLEDGS